MRYYGNLGLDTCERCGVRGEDLHRGKCFVCKMLEGPRSSVSEVGGGLVALGLQMLDVWTRERRNYGFPVAKSVAARIRRLAKRIDAEPRER